MNLINDCFVTIFLPAENVHCYKDVGMIPRIMSKETGIKSYLVCIGKGEYDDFDDLELIKLGSNKIFSEIKQLLFICTNAKKIKILNLYHWGIRTLIAGVLYKAFNRKGKLYVKCDMGDRGVDEIRKNPLRSIIIKALADISDLISVESSRVANRLNLILKNKKVELIPNGIVSNKKDSSTSLKERKKIILTVGQLGTKAKATEDLVEAFVKISDKIPDWKLLLVGSMTDEFKKYISAVKNSRLDLSSKIECTGEIRNRKELSGIYTEASIFVLPSRWESFGLVMLEALSYGCYFIGSDKISPVEDFIINDNYGKIFESGNKEQLSSILLNTINSGIVNDENLRKERINHIINSYNWTIICKKIIKFLKS